MAHSTQAINQFMKNAFKCKAKPRKCEETWQVVKEIGREEENMKFRDEREGLQQKLSRHNMFSCWIKHLRKLSKVDQRGEGQHVEREAEELRLHLQGIGELPVRWPGEDRVGGGEGGLCCNPNPPRSRQTSLPTSCETSCGFLRDSLSTEVERWLEVGKQNPKSLSFAVTECYCWKQWSKIQSSTKLQTVKGYGHQRNQETFSSTPWGPVSGALQI